MKVLGFAMLAMVLTGEAQAGPWDQVGLPAPGPAEAIGAYANGCLAGGVDLPPEAPGYETIRRGRNRYWAHPALKSWVDGFGRELAKRGVVVLVGDVAQPRGGPMPSGHVSHQIGLDIDIWFRLGPLSPAERGAPVAFSVVAADGLGIERSRWLPQHAEMLKLAASAPEVDRILVNAAIKQELCRSTPPGERGWLRKLRPWFGHDSHFHLRLACPSGSPDCIAQSPPPPGDGCDDLAWWFSAEALTPKRGPAKERPPLPERCEAVLRR